MAGFYELVKSLPYKQRQDVTPGLYQLYLSEPGWLLPRSWIHSLSAWMHIRWEGQAIWQWVSLMVTLGIGFALMLAIYSFGRWRARILQSDQLRYLVTLVFPVAAMLVPLGLLYFLEDHVRISGTVLIVIIYTLWLIFLAVLFSGPARSIVL